MLQIFLIDGYFKGNQRQNHVLRQTQSTIYKKQSSNIDVFTFSGVKLPNSNFLRCDTNSRGSERSIKGLVHQPPEWKWNDIFTRFTISQGYGLKPLVPMQVKESPWVVKVQMLSSWFFWISRMNIPKMNFFIRIWIFTNILNEMKREFTIFCNVLNAEWFSQLFEHAFLWCYAFQQKW